MNRGIIYAAIKNKTVTLFMVLLISIVGLYSYYIVPRQEVPNVSAPVAKITAIYPGASPNEVEKLVTRKIEDKLVGIEGYDYCQSFSKNGISISIIYLNNDADIDKAWSDLRAQMNDLQAHLPEQCQKIQVDTNLIETAGVIISISGDSYSYEQLATFAEDFKKELSRVDGVSRFDVNGKLDKEVKVNVDIDRLNLYKLSLDDIVNILKAQNVEIPSGAIEDGSSSINVKTTGRFESLDDIKNTVITVSKDTGAVARLKDIAEVTMDIEDSAYKVMHNGKKAVLLTGYCKENKNIVLVGEELEKRLKELKSRLPSDVAVDKVLYQPKDVHESVMGFILNLIEGMLFVMVVVFLGMGLRNAVVVSAVIPISILITFGAMKVFGIEIHMISITALIIALGMLVDNAIVVSDSIQVKIDSGEDKLDACINGTKETALPILTSTLTTVAVFIPLLVLPGVAGEFLLSIPQICIISLSASYIVALFVTPTMAFMFFKKGINKEKKSLIRAFFSSLLESAMKRKGLTVIIAVIVFAGALRLIPVLGLSFFPAADKNIIYIDIKADNAVDLSMTEKVAGGVEEILKNMDVISTYTTAIGDGFPKFYYSMKPAVQSKDYAQILARFDLKADKNFKTKEQLVDHLQSVLDKDVTGGRVTVRLLENGEPIGSPVRVRIVGEDMDDIIQVARNVEEKLRSIEGTVNVSNDIMDKDYEYLVTMNMDKISGLGFTKAEVQKQINIALRGTKSSVYFKGGNEYDIVVKSDIKSKEELENLAVKASLTGNKVLLKQIAKIGLNPQLQEISKHDRDISVSVTSDIKPGYSSVTIQNELEQLLSTLDTGDVEVRFDGERERINKYFGDVGIIAIFAMLVIYLIIMIQFGSLVQPLIIMLTIPMSVVGSVIGLFVSGNPLSFTALLGMVSLIGIVVNNAIILVDFINNERKHGKTLEDACWNAARKRFRPVMLTTVTTVIGLVPLALSGSSMFGPMAISLMSGLMIATLLTLVVIPVVFCMVINKVEKST